MQDQLSKQFSNCECYHQLSFMEEDKHAIEEDKFLLGPEIYKLYKPQINHKELHKDGIRMQIGRQLQYEQEYEQEYELENELEYLDSI